MAHEQSDFLFLQQYAQPPDSSFCSRYTVTGLDFSSNAAQLLSAQSSWNQSTFEYGDIGDDDVEERSSLHDPNSFLQQDSITHDHQYFSLGGGDGDIQLFDVDPSSIFTPSTHHHDYRPNHIEDGLVVDTDYSTKSMINHVFPTPLFDSSISSAFSTPSSFSNHEPSYDSNDMIVDLNVLETTSFSPKANSISSSSILATKVYNTEPCNKELDMKMIMKRPRMEMPSPMPTFKVRKEKLGDRVTALQQLVSPFGKNDTASVLHEATKYIKFLHNQVLSATNISDGNPIQQHQMNTKRWDRDKKISDLRSRGLCLVPISTTFQLVNESSSPNYLTTMFEGTF